jgi:hypothetical protein
MIFSGNAKRDAEQLNRLVYFSKGDPNGTVRAGPGALCLNQGGGTGATLWVKESGNGATGWVAK